MATGRELQQAYDLIRSGNKQHAANMLTVLLVTDPQNADAWWLLALAAPTAEIVQRALCRLLELRPDDTRARQLLDSMGVRRLRDESRAAALRRAQDAHAAALEPRRSQLRRREGRRVSALKRRHPVSILIALGIAAIVCIAGCAVLTLALASGLQLVGRAGMGFQPVQAAPAPQMPETFDLGDINGLGNTGYTQFRGGLLESAADRHVYTFSGMTGDVVSVEVTALDGTRVPALSIYTPDGRLIVGNVGGDATSKRVVFMLPAVGVYTIAVAGQETYSSYRLTLSH